MAASKGALSLRWPIGANEPRDQSLGAPRHTTQVTKTPAVRWAIPALLLSRTLPMRI